MRYLIALLLMLMVTVNAQAVVVFETNFDAQPAWNPANREDACWQNIAVSGGANSCTSGPWGSTWADANTIWNDYRVLSALCSPTVAPHIGSASEILSATGKSFTPYGGSGKSYVHFYEPCMGGSFGSDGLLGMYFGKTTGYTELYVQMKVKFDPDWQWADGQQMKLLHFTHFDETYEGGVLQSTKFFHPHNMPTIDPGIYWHRGYNSIPGFYINSYNADISQSGGTIGYPNSVNIFDGNWHTLQFRVKLNTAAGAADGISETWLDTETTATPVLRHTNLPYTGSYVPTAQNFGFNRVLIGGNTSNLWLGSNPSCKANKTCPTQLYVLDNLVISTTPIPLDYSVGGDAPDTFAPVTTANPAAGTYTETQGVTLTADEEATIYYTTNGSTPTTGSAVYSAPIGISSTTTLKYFARDAAGNEEDIHTDVYTITEPDPNPQPQTSTPRLRADHRFKVR